MVDTIEVLNGLEINYKEFYYIKLIVSNDRFHPSLLTNEDNLLAIYLYNVKDKTSKVINICHRDYLPIDIDAVEIFLSKFKNLITEDRKYIKYFLNIDVKSLRHYNKDFDIEYRFDYSNYKRINQRISLSKIKECIDRSVSKINFDFVYGKYYSFYDGLEDILFELEKTPIKINKEMIGTHFKHTLFNVEGEYLHQYHTLNRYRPSNSFNNINLYALNKHTDVRKCIIPENDVLINLDYKACHISLLFNLLKTELRGDVYELLSEELYGTRNRREDIKSIIFKIFFSEDLYFSEKSGYFEDILNFKKKLISEIDSNSVYLPIVNEEVDFLTKVSDYFQLYETLNNVSKMKEVLSYIKGYKTKLIMYTYDSFLFDFDKSELFLVKGIKDILEEMNLKVSLSVGYNYLELTPYTKNP